MASLRQFARRMRRLGDSVERNADRTVVRTALAVHQPLVTSTPVDEGVARSNWLPSVTGAPVASAVEEALSEDGALDAGRSVIERYEGGPGIYISNPLPYIVPLNSGSSEQAPAGFVEDAIQLGNQTARNEKVLK